jgi:hypothetical protein
MSLLGHNSFEKGGRRAAKGIEPESQSCFRGLQSYICTKPPGEGGDTATVTANGLQAGMIPIKVCRVSET